MGGWCFESDRLLLVIIMGGHCLPKTLCYTVTIESIEKERMGPVCYRAGHVKLFERDQAGVKTITIRDVDYL